MEYIKTTTYDVNDGMVEVRIDFEEQDETLAIIDIQCHGDRTRIGINRYEMNCLKKVFENIEKTLCVKFGSL